MINKSSNDSSSRSNDTDILMMIDLGSPQALPGIGGPDAGGAQASWELRKVPRWYQQRQ